MVPVIEFCGQIQDMHPWVGELHNLDPGFPHVVVVGRSYREIGDVLVQKTNLDPFPCLLHQKTLDRLAALVVAEMEIFNVD